MVLKKIGDIKNSSKIISGILTLIIIGILLFSGPAKAITLGITDISDTTPNEESTVSFLAKIDIHTNDRIPLTNITVNMKNSSGDIADTCTFNLAGVNLTACTNFNIANLHSNYNYSASLSGYGYGYGYDSNSGTYTNINQSFGYGYGYLAGYGYNTFNETINSGTGATTAEFIYNVTWTTPSVAADSTYSIQLMAYANDGTNTARYYTKTDSSDITVQNVEAATTTTTTSGSSGTRSYTLTDTEFSEGYTKQLRNGDKMVFNFASDSHSLTIKNLNSTTATIEIASTPQTVTLNVGEEKKIELSGDNYYDLLVKLNSIALNKADITIKTIYEEIISQQPEAGEDGTIPGSSEDEQSSEEKERENLTWFWILIGGITLLILFGIGYKKFKETPKKKI